MDKIENPYQVMLERLRVLDQSIYILNLVNNDFREILRKQYIELNHFFNSYLYIYLFKI
jgi:hypothetical protein